MSSSSLKLPGINKRSNYWRDVEVPYTKIKNKWSNKYRPRLSNHKENSRLQKKVLGIYFEYLGRSDYPNDREKAVDQLDKAEHEYALNLCCQFEYANGKSESIVRDHAKGISSKISGTPYEEFYDKNIGKNNHGVNKDGLVALVQLFEPEKLKHILIQDHVQGRVPTNIYKRNGGGRPSHKNWSKVISLLTKGSAGDYAIWEQFEFDGNRYVAIEEEDRDGVERQVGDNIEEEPANVIIIEFEGDYMRVYCNRKSTTNKVKSGVNKDSTGSNYDEDRNDRNPSEVFDLASTAVKHDSGSGNPSHDYILTKIKAEVPDLNNNPEVQLSSDFGVGGAIKQLDEAGIDILSSPRGIKMLKIRFEGRIFTVRYSDTSKSNNSNYKELVYSSLADADKCQSFEDMFEKEFGLSVNLKSASKT